MDTVLLLARLGLAAVFAVAAWGKLADRDGSRWALEQFGVPAGLTGVVSVGLPVVESLLALGLVAVGTAAWSAVAAAVLLAIFCIAIGRVLARGEAPDCHCFGTVGSAAVGRGTLVRNVGLGGMAVFVAVVGWRHAGQSVPALVRDLGTVAIVFGIAAAFQATFSWQLLRQNGRLLDRLEALEAHTSQPDGAPSAGRLIRGTTAPPFALPDLDGQMVTLDDVLAAGRGALLFFTDPDCGHCDPLLPALAAPPDGAPVVVISRGSVQANRAKAGAYGLAPVLRQADFEVADAYRAFGVPAAVLVDRAGKIASEIVAGADGVTAMLKLPVPGELDLVHVGGGA